MCVKGFVADDQANILGVHVKMLVRNAGRSVYAERKLDGRLSNDV